MLIKLCTRFDKYKTLGILRVPTQEELFPPKFPSTPRLGAWELLTTPISKPSEDPGPSGDPFPPQKPPRSLSGSLEFQKLRR